MPKKTQTKNKSKSVKKKTAVIKKNKNTRVIEEEIIEEENESSEKTKKSLVIVESPGKVKTISKFLGKKFTVKASIGHVRDLPGKGLGVDVKNNFEPTYEILEDKEKIVKELKQLAKSSEMIYLAQDPDREGEAIAWHLYEILGNPSRTKRIVCNEITKDAITSAIKNPREIDQDLVNAQQARRILDRLVGYKISPLLWKKIGGKSAGRVQSVALRLIFDRENEVRLFKTEEYWSIHAEVEKDKISFITNLYKWDNKTISTPKGKDLKTSLIIRTKDEVDEIVKELKKAEFKITNIEEKESSRNPQPPFITSTLQRACSNLLGFSVKKVMKVAQELYEGADIGEDGPVGLITYMRTDSTRISKEAQDESKDFVVKNYGSEYYPPTPRSYVQKKKNVQDAHEAIRPTSVFRTPSQIKKYLTSDQYRVYKLIWERFLASQMASIKLNIKTIEITAGKGLFHTNANTVLFDGFLKAFEGTEEDEAIESEDLEEGENSERAKEKEFETLPELKINEKVKSKDLNPKQHFTEPPSRYSEAMLVKKLEELGIGRPSTYASTISTIIDRKYVQKLDKKILHPTFLGEKVTELLVNHFPKYLDYAFTAEMEEKLDEVEEAKLKWDKMIKKFYEGFSEALKTAQEEMKSVEIHTEHTCPTCGNKMVIKGGRFGPFLGCTNYPECKTIVNITKEGQPQPKEQDTEQDCPKCNASKMVIKHGPYGQYLQCKDDNCKHRMTLVKSTGIKCPREGCDGEIIEKRSRRGKTFYGCSSWSRTKCTSAFWNKPIEVKCPECEKLLTFKQTSKSTMIACSDQKECGYKREATEEEISKYGSSQLTTA